jgi:hypothetical protein
MLRLDAVPQFGEGALALPVRNLPLLGECPLVRFLDPAELGVELRLQPRTDTLDDRAELVLSHSLHYRDRDPASQAQKIAQLQARQRFDGT